MLYHPEKELTAERFRDPGKEYRAAPFWAWNCKLDREEMLRQIGEFKEMGFGGFHMHSRKGLETAYLGEDFLNVFETAPIPVSVDVNLKAEYVSPDSLEVVRKEISGSPLVEEVVYQQSLVDKLNTNLAKISLVLAVFVALLLFISFVLINNTVRLNVFSKRFTIHTMKLVGATKSFIRGPFLGQSIFQGLFSALLAILMLLGALFIVRREVSQLFEVFSLDLLLVVLGIVVVSGVVICFVSTYLVVGKLVSLPKDELYY